MAQIGALGDIVFEVSDKTVRTFQSMSWQGSVRIAEHKRHNMNAMTEFEGIDADVITFKITLSTALGVDPMTELKKIWKYERGGIYVPLVVGDHAYGKNYWLIKNHKTDMQRFDKSGNLISASVTISLIEYLA